jgi:hypothetical protein
MSHLRYISAVCALVALFVAETASAQILYGSIVGHVADQSGAAIPRGSVTITNKATGLVREAQADQVGNYEFANVPPGTYEVRITATGFNSSVTSDVAVTINTLPVSTHVSKSAR